MRKARAEKRQHHQACDTDIQIGITPVSALGPIAPAGKGLRMPAAIGTLMAGQPPEARKDRGLAPFVPSAF